MCSLSVDEMEGPYSARFPSSSIGGEIPTCACWPGGCRRARPRLGSDSASLRPGPMSSADRTPFFEHEPVMAPGLVELDNVVIVPHIASATRWTREGMAILAACNVAGLLRGDPLWQQSDILPFLEDDPPKAIPSIVNARELNMQN